MGIILMKFGGNSRQQTMGQVLGGALVGAIFALVLGVSPDMRQNLIAFIAGTVTALGILFQLKAFHSMGVSRVMPLTTGGQLIGFALLGVLVFGEWIGTPALPVGILGVALVLVGVVLTGWTEGVKAGDPVPVPAVEPAESGELGYASGNVDTRKSPAPSDRPTAAQLRTGTIQTLISTVFYVGGPFLIQLFKVDPVTTFLPQSLGWLVMGTIITFPLFTRESGSKDDRISKYTLRAMIPGAMWALGVVIMQFSQTNVGVAIGFSLSQMGIVISTFGGIWFLGETRTKKEMKVISVGVVCLVVGTAVLGLAKSLDVVP